MENTGDEVTLLHLLPILRRIIGLTDTHKQFGITKSQIIIFIVLHYRGSVTMSEVAQYISSSKEQATRAVAVLCDNGLIERFEDAGNRTHVLIRLTEQGKAHLQRLIAKLRSEVAERLAASLDEEEIHELNQAVNTVVTLLGKVK